MPDSIQRRSEYYLVNLFCTCGSKKKDWLTYLKGRIVFMWVLPMTSLAVNVKKSFFETKGQAQNFQLPIQAGLQFPSSIIKFPFPLSMQAWIAVTLTWGPDISLWRPFKSSSFQASLKAMHHPLHSAWVQGLTRWYSKWGHWEHKKKEGSKFRYDKTQLLKGQQLRETLNT